MAANRKAFNKVFKGLEEGKQLTFDQIGEVFGQEFWIMLTIALMDSQEAARAIQGAISRLRTGEAVPEDQVEQVTGEEVI